MPRFGQAGAIAGYDCGFRWGTLESLCKKIGHDVVACRVDSQQYRTRYFVMHQRAEPGPSRITVSWPLDCFLQDAFSRRVMHTSIVNHNIIITDRIGGILGLVSVNIRPKKPVAEHQVHLLPVVLPTLGSSVRARGMDCLMATVGGAPTLTSSVAAAESSCVRVCCFLWRLPCMLLAATACLCGHAVAASDVPVLPSARGPRGGKASRGPGKRKTAPSPGEGARNILLQVLFLAGGLFLRLSPSKYVST
jgi:hypothetical protein